MTVIHLALPRPMPAAAHAVFPRHTSTLFSACRHHHRQHGNNDFSDSTVDKPLFQSSDGPHAHYKKSWL
ncbi:unnamed protein product [Linum trigynum]|uniref:Secreted protein n=1 Tax=Linum trigynum TaxID=586398 RepID=A0AAV2E5F2_9ROSI